MINPDRSVDLFDVDGTLRAPLQGAPHQELVELLRLLSQSGDIVAVTGMAPESLLRMEQATAFIFAEAWVSYATLRRRSRGGDWEGVGDPLEQAAYIAARPLLLRVCAEQQGVLDDERAVFTAFFPPGSDQFAAARDAIAQAIAPEIANSQLRLLANPDGGITVLPFGAGKHHAVDHFHRSGAFVRIAAGDTRSDLPLLEAAAFPIVTIAEEGGVPHPELVAVVERRGVGFVCQRHNGHGLTEAILAARSAGVVSF